ncbi:MAG: hypothetical protein ACLPZR_05825 [Solirubrobacteraceae bacterium]
MIGIIAAATTTTPSDSSTTIALVAIIAGAFVGVLGPAVGGVFLWLNTGRTIAAERHRLTATLQAQDKLHRDQIAFVSGETDLAELRGILDALAERLFALDHHVRTASVVFGTMLDAVEPDPDLARELDRAMTDLREAISTLGDPLERLNLRIGADGRVLCELARNARLRAYDAAVWARKEVITDNYAALRTQACELAKLREQFTAEALKFTEARLHKPRASSPSMSRAGPT